jgi:hypothetical protein
MQIRRIKNSSRDPILKNPITKNWASGMAQGEGLEFKPQYCKKKRKKMCHQLSNLESSLIANIT